MTMYLHHLLHHSLIFMLLQSSILSLALNHQRRTIIASSCNLLFWNANCNVAQSAETIGKDPDCNDASCLGVWDGLLADCPHGNAAGFGNGCVSSQDDTPGIFAEPWDYSDLDDLNWEKQMKVLVPAVQLVLCKRGDSVVIDSQQERYLRATIKNKIGDDDSTAEFYFTENDTTVQFRIGSQNSNRSNVGFMSNASKQNMERAEEIRKYMRYTKLPVLRNRQMKFMFGESELDTFGPGSASLGPPAEMKTGELEGRQSSNIDVISALK